VNKQAPKTKSHNHILNQNKPYLTALLYENLPSNNSRIKIIFLPIIQQPYLIIYPEFSIILLSDPL
jgi:hypothetical protein